MLELSSASKRYGPHRAVLAEVSLQSSGGEFLAVSGQPGTGKSTLLRLITGLEMPTTGDVSVFSCHLARLRAASLRRLRTRMGIHPQEILLSEEDTVLDNVSMPLELRGEGTVSCFHRASEVLEELGIGALADVQTIELSTSERRLVSLARALVGEPELIVLDAPEDGLSSSQSERMARAVEERVLSGRLVLSTGFELGALWQGVVAPKRSFELSSGQLSEVGCAAPGADDAVPNVLPFPITARAGGE